MNSRILQSMNIVVDSGNTFSKIGWFEHNTMLGCRYGLSFSELMETVNAFGDSPDSILYSSVNVPVETFKGHLQLKVPVLHLTNEVHVPIAKNYDTPDTLGVDRIAASVGAVVVVGGGNVLVIDMGSCITCDYVDADNVFQGGMILPGMKMRYKAMHTFTARLPLVETVDSPPLIGKSTVSCMQSGVVNGIISEINGIIENFRNNYKDCSVVMCGGDLTFFENHIKPPIFAVPELVLIGLNRILQYNVA